MSLLVAGGANAQVKTYTAQLLPFLATTQNNVGQIIGINAFYSISGGAAETPFSYISAGAPIIYNVQSGGAYSLASLSNNFSGCGNGTPASLLSIVDSGAVILGLASDNEECLLTPIPGSAARNGTDGEAPSYTAQLLSFQASTQNNVGQILGFNTFISISGTTMSTPFSNIPAGAPIIYNVQSGDAYSLASLSGNFGGCGIGTPDSLLSIVDSGAVLLGFAGTNEECLLTPIPGSAASNGTNGEAPSYTAKLLPFQASTQNNVGQVGGDNTFISISGTTISTPFPNIPAGAPIIYNVQSGVAYSLASLSNNLSGCRDATPVSPQSIVDSGAVILGVAGDNEQCLLTPTNIELLDGRSFVSGNTLASDPATLGTGGTPVVGVGADGAAEVLVRITTKEPGSLTVSLDDSVAVCGSGSTDLVTMGSLADATSRNPTYAAMATVNTTTTAPYQAYLWYRAPREFNRQNCLSDESVSSRLMNIKNQGTGATSADTSSRHFTVNRTPIVLVHGLWSDASTWQPALPSIYANSANTVTTLQNSLGLDASSVFVADYKPTHASWFYVNSIVVQTEINNAIFGTYLSKKQISVVKADVIGHSMGGVLSRIYSERGAPVSKADFGCLPGAYQNPLNFCSGSINRLITVGSPMLGAPAADFLFALSLSPVISHAFASIDKAIDQGAIDDLKTTSTSLNAMRLNSSPSLPVHAVVGDVTPNGVPLPVLSPNCELGTATLPCNVLAFAGYVLPFYEHSDTIVPISSAGAGLPGANQSTFAVPHFSLPPPTTDSPGLAGQTSNTSIAAELVRLLNEQSTAPDYAPSF